jgi:hypothetical protein
MDDGDPTTAEFNEFESVLDNAVNEFYEENARGDAAIVNVGNDSDDDVIVNVDDNSDAPPNVHEVPSGSKRKLPLHMDVGMRKCLMGRWPGFFSLFGCYISITL